MNHQGRLTRWNDDKGFGFITPQSGGKDVFAHISTYQGRGRPRASAQVHYQLGTDEHHRPCAARFRTRGARASGMPAGVMFAWLTASAVMLLLGAGGWSGYLPWRVSVVYPSMSLVTYLAYRADKRAATEGERRIPENILHLMELACGWPGALVAQQTLRHKTRKTRYRFVFWCAVLLNIGAAGWLIVSPDTAHVQQVLGCLLSAGETMIRGE